MGNHTAQYVYHRNSTWHVKSLVFKLMNEWNEKNYVKGGS
jgi:hypothetical protein